MKIAKPEVGQWINTDGSTVHAVYLPGLRIDCADNEGAKALRDILTETGVRYEVGAQLD